jgi:hypothetical protein
MNDVHADCDTFTDVYDEAQDVRVISWPCGLVVNLGAKVPPAIYPVASMHDAYFAPRVPPPLHRPVMDALATFTASGGVCAPMTPYYDLTGPPSDFTRALADRRIRTRIRRAVDRVVWRTRSRLGHWLLQDTDDEEDW